MSSYIHGDDARERARLIAQAEFWRDLILDGLDLKPGQSLLEVGCGTGAVLDIIGRAFPHVSLAGLDISQAQLDGAASHLRSRAVQADLCLGSADHLPWPDASFDHAFFMWMLEHLNDALPALKETRRVLRPGGRITITETDYTFSIHPESSDFDELMAAWKQLFRERGNAVVARTLGPLLVEAGFRDVRNRVWNVHEFTQPGSDSLRRLCNYIADFMEPECAVMAREQGREERALRRGIQALRALADHPRGSFTGIIFRATATV